MSKSGLYSFEDFSLHIETAEGINLSVRSLAPEVDELSSAVDRFIQWLDKTGYASYDPYDVWGAGYGRLARRLYYEKHPAGPILTAPLILLEIVFPQFRRLLIKKNRYATADAQLILAFLNLHKACQDSRFTGRSRSLRSAPTSGDWLERARELAEQLLEQSVSGFSGYCWGYPFDWQNVNGLMPKNTPHITATPYCYEAFTRLYDLTGDTRYLEVSKSISRFVFSDLGDTETGNDSAASSYTPFDRGKVVNASAYRAFVLFDAAERFENEGFRQKAWKNLRFILESQQADGSWLYAIDNPKEAFIDHFHTCFVLKNLYKINRQLRNEDLREAIERGYRWYRQALFDREGSPRSFAIAPRTEIVRLEMYNVAEAVSLGVLLKEDLPEAFALAGELATGLLRRHQLKAGHWVTRVYFGGFRHTMPFLRWPQSQLFLALTNVLLAALSEEDAVRQGTR